MKHNENSRVKIPALVHLTRLGYEYLSLKDYQGEIHTDTNIFVEIFRNSISHINGKTLSEHDTVALISELSVKLSNEDLGKAFYNILLNGINGIRLIDFEDSSRNTYHVVTELTYRNGDDEFRPDIILLINGMPLSLWRSKSPTTKTVLLPSMTASIPDSQERYSAVSSISPS